ncbi:MAG: Crp/Fnr family transcriptional regulator [Bacillota bacterium]
MHNLNEFFILENMSKSELKKIKEYSRIKKCNKNEQIFLEGEQAEVVYLILSGYFKVFKTNEQGRDKTLNLLSRGEFFGFTALFKKGTYSNSVQALREGELLAMERNKYKKLLEVSPEVALKTIGALSLRLQQANQEIQDLTFKNIEARLKNALHHLGEKFGVKEDGQIRIEQIFTHQDLADIVGTTRATITRHLGEMQDEGLIKVKDKQIYLNSGLV